MAFELQRGRGIGAEIRRLLDRQLEAAVEALTGPSIAAHDARRRLKKARALLLLARPALNGDYRAANRRLRTANHLLGAFTDADAVVETLANFRGFDVCRLPAQSLSAIRQRLLENSAEQKAAAAFLPVRARVVRLLTKQRARLRESSLSACGVSTTAAMLRKAHRAARIARDHALARPSVPAIHAWRRRTKMEWHLFRLIGDGVGGRLVDDERRLETLDGCLGDLHDIAVLQQHLVGLSPLTRPQTAAALRVTRDRARDLTRRARLLADAQDEPPRELEARVLALWRSGLPLPAEPAEAVPWPHHA